MKLKPLITEQYRSMYVHSEYDDMDDEDIDFSNIEHMAYTLARRGGINILRDKELFFVVTNDDISSVVGALWISNDTDSFSFDVVVNPSHQGKGILHMLMTAAFDEYDSRYEVYSHQAEYPMELDVVNPKMVSILKSKYGFHEVERDGTHTIMRKDGN